MEKNNDIIGIGQFGEVYKVALKKIKKIYETKEEFENEINILKKLDGEYCVNYIGHYETKKEYNDLGGDSYVDTKWEQLVLIGKLKLAK